MQFLRFLHDPRGRLNQLPRIPVTIIHEPLVTYPSYVSQRPISYAAYLDEQSYTYNSPRGSRFRYSYCRFWWVSTSVLASRCGLMDAYLVDYRDCAFRRNRTTPVSFVSCLGNCWRKIVSSLLCASAGLFVLWRFCIGLSFGKDRPSLPNSTLDLTKNRY